MWLFKILKEHAVWENLGLKYNLFLFLLGKIFFPDIFSHTSYVLLSLEKLARSLKYFYLFVHLRI